MASRALIVTTLALCDLDRQVNGVHQRFRMLLDAAKGVYKSIEILRICTANHLANLNHPQEVEDREVERQLHNSWDVRCHVHGGAWATPAHLRPWILEQASWALSYRRTRQFAGLDTTDNRRLLKRLVEPVPAIVIAHKLHVMEFVGPLLPNGVQVLFDLDDIEHIAFERRLQYIKHRRDRLIALATVPVIRGAVRRAVNQATNTLVCSSHDKVLLDREFGLEPGKVAVVPNSSVVHGRDAIVEAPTLLFVGSFNWPPNLEAVEFFLRRCWTHIKTAVPAARLLVVGSNPESVAVDVRNVDGVDFLGFVQDIGAVYRRSRVVVCPILSGGGTRVKLVEAAAYGKPIVSTTLGAEGLEFENERHALLRDDVDGFANACIELLQSEERCERLSRAVHAQAARTFDRDRVLETVRKLTRGSSGPNS